MVVIEYPEQGVGVHRRLLDKILRTAEIPQDDVWVTPLFHCQPPPGVTPSKADRDACKVWLWREITACRPEAILAMGKAPASLLQKCKVEDWDAIVGRRTTASYIKGEPTVVASRSIGQIYRGEMGLVHDAVEVLQELRRAMKVRGELGGHGVV